MDPHTDGDRDTPEIHRAHPAPTPSAPPEPDSPREYRLGPITFVPGLQHRPNDPWAHRKGEPRFFALLWAIYLMAAALFTLFAVRTVGPPLTDQFHYGARAMLELTAVGALILWPMTRLSQLPAQRPAHAICADLVVILVPIQALVWPLPLLTRWNPAVIASIALMLTAWTVLVASILLPAQRSRAPAKRAAAMGAIILASTGAPILQLFFTRFGAPLPPVWNLLSPYTAILELTSAPSGLAVRTSRTDWVFAAAPLVFALVILLPQARKRRRAAPSARG